MKKLSLLVSTGNLGDNVIEEKSFYEGLKKDIHYFAADGGSADVGPTTLGSDMPHNPVEWEEHDLELLLLASIERGVPMIVGSSSTTGTDRGVNLHADLIRKLAKRHKLPPFKMATIYSQVSKEELTKRVERGDTEPLGAPYPINNDVIKQTKNLTASMGVEQIMHALEQKAQVVIAGRTCDDAVLAAYPVYCGFDKGISLHMGKASECASLVCWPQKVKESIVATTCEDSFTIEPMHPDQAATPHSVAAHCMYERTHPYIQGLPGGILDMHESCYVAESERICRVYGSRFIPSEDRTYKVKLEGAGEVGHRVYNLVGIRDSRAIPHIKQIVADTKEKVDQIIGPERRDKYELYFHVYGQNAIMKDLEPLSVTTSHELAIVIEVISQDIELATSVSKCAKFRFFYMSYPGQMNSSGGSVALITDEPLYPKNKCYKWTLDHLLRLDDPLDPGIFRYNFEMVQGN